MDCAFILSPADTRWATPVYSADVLPHIHFQKNASPQTKEDPFSRNQKNLVSLRLLDRCRVNSGPESFSYRDNPEKRYTNLHGYTGLANRCRLQRRVQTAQPQSSGQSASNGIWASSALAGRWETLLATSCSVSAPVNPLPSMTPTMGSAVPL